MLFPGQFDVTISENQLSMPCIDESINQDKTSITVYHNHIASSLLFSIEVQALSETMARYAWSIRDAERAHSPHSVASARGDRRTKRAEERYERYDGGERAEEEAERAR